MYYPDGMELSAAELIDMSKKRKEIRHSNTRLPSAMLAGSTTQGSMLSGTSGGSTMGTGVFGEPLTPQVHGFVTQLPCPLF